MSTPDPFYDRFKPAQTDPFASWQYNIQTNFNILNTVFSKNHVGFKSATQPSATDQGKHQYVQLKAGIEPQTNIGENNIYTKLDAFGASQLFMAMQGNTSDFQYSAFQKIDAIFSFTSALPGNFIWSFGIYNYTGPNSVIPVHVGYIENVVFISVTPVLIGDIRNNFFYVKLVQNEKDVSINVTWNGTSATTPTQLYFMYIEKLKEVAS